MINELRAIESLNGERGWLRYPCLSSKICEWYRSVGISAWALETLTFWQLLFPVVRESLRHVAGAINVVRVQ